MGGAFLYNTGSIVFVMWRSYFPHGKHIYVQFDGIV